MATRTNLVTTPRPGRNLSRYISYGTVGTAYAEGDALRIDLPTAGDRGMIHPALTLSPGTYYASVSAQTGASATNAAFVVKRQSDQGLLLERHVTTTNTTQRIGGSFTLTSSTVVEIVLAQGAYSGTSSGSVWFRSLLLEAATAEGTFFDGDTTDTASVDYSWQGTAQASVSTAADITTTPPADPGSGSTDPALEAKCRAVWEGIKHRYLRADGAVLQKESDNKVVSEGQAYMMMVAAQLGDWATFDLVESFNVQVLERANGPRPTIGPSLLAWDYRPTVFGGNPPNTVNDWNFATDADVDRYKALMWSFFRRGSVRDRDKALAISRELKEFGFNVHPTSGNAYQITDEWQQSGPAGARVAGHHVDGTTGTQMEVNVSYIDPSTYYLAKTASNDVWWDKAIAGGWDMLTKVSNNAGGIPTTKGLFPDWNDYGFTNNDANALTAGQRGWGYSRSTDMKYDGFRTVWRIAWTWDWYRDPNALTLLSGNLKTFYTAEWAAVSKIAAEYAHDGSRLSGGYEAAMMTMGAYMALTADDPSNATAAAMWTAKLNPNDQYNPNGGDGFAAWYTGDGGGNPSYFGDFWSQFFYLRQAGLWNNFGQTAPPTGTVAAAVTDAGTGDDVAIMSVSSLLTILDDGGSDDVVAVSAEVVLQITDTGTSDDLVQPLNDQVPTETEGEPPTPPPILNARPRWLWVTPEGDEIELTGFVNDTEVLKGMSGYGAPPAIVRRDTVPGQPGGITREVRHGVREIALPLFALGGSVLGLEATLSRLIRAMDPWRGQGTLRRVDVFGNVADLMCRCNGGLEMQGSGANGPSNLRVMPILQADDPYFYRATVTQGFAGGAAQSFFPILPMRLASSSVIGDITIETESDVLTWPTWTVMGPGSALAIENTTTGERLAMNVTLTEGQTVTIDTRPYRKWVLGPDGSNYFRYLTSRSLWAFQPGVNRVSLSLTGSTANSYVSVTYRDRTLVP